MCWLIGKAYWLNKVFAVVGLFSSGLILFFATQAKNVGDIEATLTEAGSQDMDHILFNCQRSPVAISPSDLQKVTAKANIWIKFWFDTI